MLVNHSNKTFVCLSKTYGEYWGGINDVDRVDVFLRNSKSDGNFGEYHSDIIDVVEEHQIPEGYENVF